MVRKGEVWEEGCLYSGENLCQVWILADREKGLERVLEESQDWIFGRWDGEGLALEGGGGGGGGAGGAGGFAVRWVGTAFAGMVGFGDLERIATCVGVSLAVDK